MAITGTKEWAPISDNTWLGCRHRCRYCYACADAVKKGRCTHEEWGVSYYKQNARDPGRRGKRGYKMDPPNRVMLPTTSDIDPENLDAWLMAIKTNLELGYPLLITSKPHFKCIQAICIHPTVLKHKKDVMFRFSIGSMDDEVLSYWEPNAPDFEERFHCLEYAFKAGFATSISCEPNLSGMGVIDLFQKLAPVISDSFWIGKMNYARERCCPGTAEEKIAEIEAGQTDVIIKQIYASLKSCEKVKWKESYKRVLGLKLVEEVGLDI